MFTPAQLLEGATDVWLLWACSSVLLIGITWRLSAHTRCQPVRCPRRGERGSSYVLTVALIIPFYATLIAVIIECTLLLVAKIGTTYAACAAARSAAVWLAADAEPAQRRYMVELAAAQALAPFASGQSRHAITGTASADDQAGSHYVAAYQHYSGGQAPPEFLLAKHRYARAATTVKWERKVSTATNCHRLQDVTVTVTYHCPIQTPGLGRLFGDPAPWPDARFATREITAQATLQLETPKTRNQTLGIHYDSWNY